MGEKLGAIVKRIRDERLYKVEKVTSSVSKLQLQVGDAILYVNGKYSVHMEMKEFTDTDRESLFPFLSGFPSLPSTFIELGE
jgi:hypothetical protein